MLTKSSNLVIYFHIYDIKSSFLIRILPDYLKLKVIVKQYTDSGAYLNWTLFFNGIFIDGKKMAHKKNENEFYDF